MNGGRKRVGSQLKQSTIPFIPHYTITSSSTFPSDVSTNCLMTLLPSHQGSFALTSPQALPPPSSACLLQRLVELSRAARPGGSRPAFAWGDVATPIRPITRRLSLAPSSVARLRVGRPCGFPTPKGRRRVYHVPSMYREKVRSRLSAGGASSACGKFGIPQLVPLPLGPGLSASLACHQ